MKQNLNSKLLGEEIQARLRKQKITQVMLAERLGVTQGQISNIIRGRFKTKNSLVARVCNYLKIRLHKYRDFPEPVDEVFPDAKASLVRLCSGPKARGRTIQRILSLLEQLEHS